MRNHVSGSFFKFINLLFFSLDADDISPGDDTQFGIERFQHFQIGVLYTIEDARVCFIQQEMFFYHGHYTFRAKVQNSEEGGKFF